MKSKRCLRPMRWLLVAYAIATFGAAARPAPARAERRRRLRIAVRFSHELGDKPLDGRLLVMLSTEKEGEPRFQIRENARTQQIFGVEVDGLVPGQEAVIDETTLGYPLESLRMVPPGKYRIQALLHKYETFHRADGHVVKLPMDRGEGQQWNRAPGNLYSTPREITIEAGPRGAARVPRPRSPSSSTRPSRRSPTRPRPDTSSTRRSRASGSRSSGAGRCTWARTCSCPRGSTSIPTHATRS